jgi:hypothetical protein
MNYEFTSRSNRVRASSRALAITLTDDSAIAAAPTIGDSKMPNATGRARRRQSARR